MTALKNCPFCGGNAKRFTESGDERNGYADFVGYRCVDCRISKGARGDTSKPGYADNSKIEEQAIENWNRRTQPEATKPAQDLGAAIMNIRCEMPPALSKGEAYQYKLGHRDARHAAAELANEAALASPADALVAGDRETTTSDSENCAHLTNCPGCDKCEALLEHYMACDECGSWGNKEANGWTKTSENQFVCESCAAIQAQKDGHG